MPVEYVSLVAQGGTPVRLANQRGAPYPTTGAGAIVFSDSPVLNHPVINGGTVSFDFVVASLSDLKALGSDVAQIALTPTFAYMQYRSVPNDGGAGIWIFDTGDQSANVALDPRSGIWAAPDSDPTGASGAWHRQYNVYVNTAWFGTGVDSIRGAQVFSKRLVFTPGENYTLPTTGGTVITATDEDVEIIAGQSTITLQTNCVALFVSHGTYLSEHTVTAINDKVLTVPGGPGTISKGSVVKMTDGITPHWWNQGLCRRGTYGITPAGEHSIVGAVTSSTVSLVSAPEWSLDRIPDNMRAILRTDISAVANNGSGGIRVTTSHPHFYTTGLNITRENIGGTTEANGTGPITVINSTQYDINNSIFANAYTSGGTCRLSCTYSTATPAGFRIGLMRDSMLQISIGKILCPASVTSHTRIIKFSNKKNPRVNIPYIQKSAGMIISPISCFGGKIEYYADGSGPGNSNYIMTVGGCDGLICEIDGSGATRHTIDGGAASTNDGITGIAASGAAAYVNVYVNASNIGSTEAAHATHGGTYRWNWHFAKARQTTGNVVVRGVGHTVYSGRSSGAAAVPDPDDPDDTTVAAGAYVSFCQFNIGVVEARNSGGLVQLVVDNRIGRGPSLATGMHVRVGSATGASAASINGYWYITLAGTTVIGSNTYLLVNLDGSTFVSADGSGNAVMDAALDAADDFTIVDATIDDSPSVMASNQGGGGNMTIIGGYWKSVGAAGAVISAGRNLKIRNLSLSYAGEPPGRIIEIGPWTESIDIDGMRVDAVGTLPYVIDINNRVQDVKILMRNLKIYNPNGALNALYRNVPNGTPPAGSRFGNIWIYGQITVPFSGLTWADVAPFVDGPIYVNDVKVADRPGGDVTLSLANNTAKSFPFTGTSIMTVSCLENTTANPTGLYVVRSSGSTVTFSPIYQEDNVTTALLTDTVLTGTTGSVGNFTMSVDTVTDRIYFENRRGVGSFRNLSITLSPWVPV